MTAPWAELDANGRAEVLAAGRRWYARNKDKKDAANRAWRLANPDKDKAAKKVRALTLKNEGAYRVGGRCYPGKQAWEDKNRKKRTVATRAQHRKANYGLTPEQFGAM